jgi:hypothetical protein
LRAVIHTIKPLCAWASAFASYPRYQRVVGVNRGSHARQMADFIDGESSSRNAPSLLGLRIGGHDRHPAVAQPGGACDYLVGSHLQRQRNIPSERGETPGIQNGCRQLRLD